jgi:hypothetical protein
MGLCIFSPHQESTFTTSDTTNGAKFGSLIYITRGARTREKHLLLGSSTWPLKNSTHLHPKSNLAA